MFQTKGKTLDVITLFLLRCSLTMECTGQEKDTASVCVTVEGCCQEKKKDEGS